MQWYYAVNNKQEGPVSEEKLQDLARLGEVTAETLVWRAGLAEWAPYGTVGLAGVPAGYERCTQCGRNFSADALMHYGAAWICSECKPAFLQRLQEGLNPAGFQIWRSGKKLVMNREAELPDRCVKCNAPANGFRLKRNLIWHPPLIFLTILISILVYAVIAIIVRKRATVFVGLCPQHRTARRRAQWIAAGMFLLSLAMTIGGSFAADAGYVMVGVLGVFGLLITLLYAIARTRTVWAARIDETHVWVKGVGAEYLAALPEWGGRN